MRDKKMLRNKLSNNMRRFIKILDDFNKENSKKPWGEREICPPETEAQLVVNCLCDLFLGEDWYVNLPVNAKQVNTVILDNILYKHCKAYRKEFNRKKKRKNRI